MGGRVTIAQIPMDRIEGASEVASALPVASVYVPAHAQLRGVFLERLAKAKVIKRNMVVGADCNCVADPTLDCRYPDGSTTKYANLHAGKWEDILASAGLQDVYRQLEGNSARGGFTRLGTSVFTRIDRIYGPAIATERQWYSLTATDELTGADWSSDHLALIAELQQVDNSEKGKGKRRIDNSIYHDEEFVTTLNKVYKSVRAAFPPSEYGYGVWWSEWIRTAVSRGEVAFIRTCRSSHRIEP